MTWYHGLLTAVCVIGIWFLYDNGYLLVKSKSALTFLGSGMGKQNHFSFRFTGCTGFVRRVMRVRGSGNYTVNLHTDLSKGEVKFLLLDRAKEPLLVLTPEASRGNIYLESGKRYHIRMEFRHASGESKASWEME